VVARGLVSVVVHAERRVWLAARPLARGDSLRATDLRVETRSFDRPPVRILDVDGTGPWRVARNVEAGSVLSPTDVTAVRAVESGHDVALVSRAGSATVSVAARARQAGDAGDVILVHNPLTGALVRAVVLQPGVVELVAAPTGKDRR
jgi:flagella basal body P-ring formation protein FlgA